MTKLLKHQEIESWLLEELSGGKFSVGDRFYSETELAIKFGTSPLTVRKAFARLVEQGLVKRHRRSGTFVEKLPERPIDLRIFNHSLIGILIGDVDLENDVKIGRILIELHLAIEKRGYLPVIAQHTPEALIDAGIKGLVTVASVDKKIKKHFVDSGIPVIEFSSMASDYPHLIPDYQGASAALIKLFASRGATHVGIVGRGELAKVTYLLFKGFIQEEARKAGLQLSVLLSLNDKEQFESELQDFLSIENTPDALFILNSWCLDIVDNVLRKYNLEIGRDLSLVVHGINALIIPHSPAYSVMDINIQTAARVSIEALQQAIIHPEENIEIPTIPYLPIIDRGSLR
jgi:DNA-binding LacI/PurR family transcriptional regulator